VKQKSTLRILKTFQPEEFIRLRERNPSAKAYLLPDGEVLGASSLEQASWDAALTMLTAIQPVANRATLETGGKLRMARRLELTATLVGATSSGAVVGATVGLKSLFGGALFGCLSLASSIIPQIVIWLKQSNIGPETAATHFAKLREHVWEAAMLQKQLSSCAPESSDAKRLIESCEKLAKSMLTALGGLGYEVVE